MKLESIGGQIQATTTQDPATQDLHLLDLLTILSLRRRFIVFFTGGATILAVIIVLLIPSEYTATTIVMPPGQNSSVSSALLGQLGGSGALASVAGASLGIKNPGEIYVSLFRSRTVEDSVIQRFGLMARYGSKRPSNTRTAFEAHSKVLLGAKDGLITISVRDRDPEKAAEIANGYIEEFRKLSANLAITEASQRRAFFQQQLLEAKENLSAAEEALKGTEQSTGVFQIDSQTRALIESAAAIRAQIVAKEVQIQGMRTYATEDNPEIFQANQQLAALQGQLARLAGANQDSGSSLIVPKGKVPEAGMEYIRKLRDVKYYDTISDLIARQLEIAKLDEARQGSVIQMVDVAVPPDHRSYPKRTITVTVTLLLSFFMACGWCIFSNSIRRLNLDLNASRRLDAFRATLRR